MSTGIALIFAGLFVPWTHPPHDSIYYTSDPHWDLAFGTHVGEQIDTGLLLAEFMLIAGAGLMIGLCLDYAAEDIENDARTKSRSPQAGRSGVPRDAEQPSHAPPP